jgi:hypothetical protein
MKTLSKNSLPEVFSNPINRNIILILVSTLAMAIIIVTASVIAYNQW